MWAPNTPGAALTTNQRDAVSGVTGWKTDRMGWERKGSSSYWVGSTNIHSSLVHSWMG